VSIDVTLEVLALRNDGRGSKSQNESLQQALQAAFRCVSTQCQRGAAISHYRADLGAARWVTSKATAALAGTELQTLLQVDVQLRGND